MPARGTGHYDQVVGFARRGSASYLGMGVIHEAPRRPSMAWPRTAVNARR